MFNIHYIGRMKNRLLWLVITFIFFWLSSVVFATWIDSYTKLLIQSDTTNGDTTFTDFSLFGNGGLEHNMSRIGEPVHSTGDSVFWDSSLYFDWIDDWLTTSGNDDWVFGTGDFTIDLWFKTNQNANYRYLAAQWDNQPNDWLFSVHWWKFGFHIQEFDTFNALLSGTTNVNDNTWHHGAISRKNGTFYLFLDGVLIDSVTAEYNIWRDTKPLSIGSRQDLQYFFNWYMDEIRISKWIARWTSNFTPPTTPYHGLKYIGNTPINWSFIDVDNLTTEVSIYNHNLKEFKYNFNGTDYSIYDSGLILMMNFDNISTLGESNSLIKDLSTYVNDGTIYGWPTWTTNTQHNWWYDLDWSNDYIYINNSSSLNPTNEISIATWFKPESFAWIGSNPIIQKPYTSHAAPWYQYSLGICGDTYSNCKARFNFSLVIDGTSYPVQTSDYVWTAWNWYFIVATYDGQALRLYVNNELKWENTSVPINGILTSYSTDVSIGKYGNLTYYTPWTIDELRVYNRSMSTGEIDLLYNSNLNKYDTDKWSFTANHTGLDEWLYAFNACSTDIADTTSCLETRIVTYWNTRDNTNFINDNFRNSNPTNSEIINALYGDGVTTGDNGTAYTKNWNIANCDIGSMSVTTLLPGTDTIPETLSENTIYVLEEWDYITTRQIIASNCSALVGKAPTWIYTDQYLDLNASTIYLPNESNIILDNIKIHGSQNWSGWYHDPNYSNIIIISNNSTLYKVHNTSSQQQWISLAGSYNYINKLVSYNNTGTTNLYMGAWAQSNIIDNSIFTGNKIAMTDISHYPNTVKNSVFDSNYGNTVFNGSQYTYGFTEFIDTDFRNSGPIYWTNKKFIRCRIYNNAWQTFLSAGNMLMEDSIIIDSSWYGVWWCNDSTINNSIIMWTVRWVRISGRCSINNSIITKNLHWIDIPAKLETGSIINNTIITSNSAWWIYYEWQNWVWHDFYNNVTIANNTYWFTNYNFTTSILNNTYHWLFNFFGNNIDYNNDYDYISAGINEYGLGSGSIYTWGKLDRTKAINVKVNWEPIYTDLSPENLSYIFPSPVFYNWYTDEYEIRKPDIEFDFGIKLPRQTQPLKITSTNLSIDNADEVNWDPCVYIWDIYRINQCDKEHKMISMDGINPYNPNPITWNTYSSKIIFRNDTSSTIFNKKVQEYGNWEFGDITPSEIKEIDINIKFF